MFQVRIALHRRALIQVRSASSTQHRSYIQGDSTSAHVLRWERTVSFVKKEEAIYHRSLSDVNVLLGCAPVVWIQVAAAAAGSIVSPVCFSVTSHL